MIDDTLNLAQLEKRVEWLDNERRNDKTAIAGLQSKIDNLGTENSTLRMRITDMESEIARLNTLIGRVEQFEIDVSNVRSDLSRQIEDIKDASQGKFIQIDKNDQRIDDMNLDVGELRKKMGNYEKFPDLIEDRKQEDIRLARLIEELKAQVIDISRFDEDYKRSLRVMEDNLRQEAKRLTDFQGEITAVRKRLDETRGKQDLVGDSMRKLEIRIKELLDAESERQEEQTGFIEKINVAQVERDRIFRSWSERFVTMETITRDLEAEVSGLEETHSAVKKSLAALDEVTQRFDRRVNEITEVQRLNEDRFRQEWTTFKSDDQKRWSNYTLAQDEQHREMNRDLTSFGDRILNVEDVLERIQDTLEQLGREDIKRMQAQLSTIRESIETFNKIFKD
jgi:chromosome segregation ATPase